MEYFTEPEFLKYQDTISLDTEYSELDIKKAELLSISIGLSDTTAGIFEPDNLHRIIPYLQHATTIFTQNGQVDWYMLKKYGCELDRHKFVDCMLMEHLIDENVQHNLGSMVLRHYDDNYKEEFWDQYTSFQDASEGDSLSYEMRDACYTFALGTKFREQIRNPVLIEHVHRLYWALFDTELRGIKVDLDLMVSTKETMGKQISEYLPKLRITFNDYCNMWELNKWAELMGKRISDKAKAAVPRPEFNFSSDTQLKWLLYDALECPIVEKTKKGLPKTDFDTISNLAKQRPELQPLVDYKGIKGIYATFVEGLLEKVQDMRIFPSFNINGTRNAGRISHSNPNMGNIPKDGPIRNFFIPDDGNCIIGADYAQLEVVIEANLTEDKQLLKIILEGASKHDITATGLGISRDQAKTLNFALQYGAGVRKVAKLLSLSIKDASEVFERYWQLYSGVKALKDKTSKEVETQGFVTTLFGRRRHFPKPSNEYEKSRFERQAYNAIIQGTGADCTNRATWLIHKYLEYQNYGKLWFSVHDEIVCEVKRDCVGSATSGIVGRMEEPSRYLNLKYPLQAKPYGPLDRWSKA